MKLNSYNVKKKECYALHKIKFSIGWIYSKEILIDRDQWLYKAKTENRTEIGTVKPIYMYNSVLVK
jgi:hypothetical protein